jgi:leader peptidase (prepilin peptidase)/N-methyltransferase
MSTFPAAAVSETAWITLAALLGWPWGSFLNTAVDRTPLAGQPATESLLRPPRSRCRGCAAALPWYDLVPIWSWLRLRGRCRACGARIGVRTLAVECATPALFSGYAWLLAQVADYSAWGALAGFGFATLSWLLVAVPLLLEGRQPRPKFLVVGLGLFAALALTVMVTALDVVMG